MLLDTGLFKIILLMLILGQLRLSKGKLCIAQQDKDRDYVGTRIRFLPPSLFNDFRSRQGWLPEIFYRKIPNNTKNIFFGFMNVFFFCSCYY